MADEYVDARISDLTAADSISDDDLFVLEQSATAKKLPGLILKNMATNAGSAAGAAAGQAFVQAAEAAADDAQDAAGAAVRAARNAQDILDDVEVAGDLALADIEDAADDSLADIAAANTSALSNISSAKTAATDAIASEKTEAMADIEAAVDEVEDAVYDIDGLKDAFLVENSKSGTFITVEDAAPLNAKKVLLTLKPHQDLHGYDHPWPPGGWKNKLEVTASSQTIAGITFTVNSDGSITANGTASSQASFYFGNISALPTGNYILNGGGGNNDAPLSITNTDGTNVINVSGDTSFTISTAGQFTTIRLVVQSGQSISNYKVYPMIRLASDTDPTFAPYSNICPIEGYTGVSVNRTGINIWDEEWELGSLDATGAEIASSGRIRSKNYIKVKSGETYYCSASMQIWIEAFDKNKTILPTIFDGTYYRYINGLAFVIPDGVSYIRFVAFGSTYNNDISINYPATDTIYHKSEVQKIIANICINQWDEEWENGRIDGTTGEVIATTNGIVSKNYIEVKPDEDYFFLIPNATNMTVAFYDSSYTFISAMSNASANTVRRIASDAAFMKFSANGYGATYNNDISINYPASFTSYFPYTGNDIAYSGTIDVGTGKMVLDRVKKIYTGADVNVNYFNNNPAGQVTFNDLTSLYEKPKSLLPICDRYKCVIVDYWTHLAEGEFAFHPSNGKTSHVKDARLTAMTATDAIAYLNANPFEVVYELATPITIQLTPQQLQMLKGLNYIWTDADDMELAYCHVKDGKSVVVGNAEQLLSKEMTNDQEPYLFRASGGNGADREYDTLVGGTIVHNQLVGALSAASITVNGIAVTVTTSDFTLTGGTSGGTRTQRDIKNVNVTANHKYFVGGGFIQLYTSGGGFVANINTTDISTWGETLYMPSTDGYFRFSAYIKENTIYQTATYIPQSTDLTAMFGSTIADHAYSLEQATAGSGIAWLKKYGFFTKPYYAYNAGELMSVKTTRHKMVGKNQFKEDTLVAGDFDGSSPTRRCHAENIHLLKGQSIIISSQDTATTLEVWGREMDSSSHTIIIHGAVKSGVPYTATNDVNICLIFGYPGSGVTVTVQEVKDINIQVEFGSVKTSYEPYTTYEYPLDPKVTLQGIYKLNGDKLYCDGDRYYPNKGVERRYKLVDLGTLNWTYNSSGNRFTSNNLYSGASAEDKLKKPTSDLIAANVLSIPFLTVSLTTLISSGTTYDCIAIGDTGNISVKHAASGTDATAFKNAMSKKYLLYELETPYFEQADPFEQLQALDPYGTEEYIDDREVPIPVGHDTNYPVNLRAEIERVMKEVPPPPTSNGTYILKVTVASGVPSYSWVAQ